MAQLSATSVGIRVGMFSLLSLITGATTIGEAHAFVEALARVPDPQLLRPPVEYFGPTRGIVSAVLVAGWAAGLAFLRECRKLGSVEGAADPDAGVSSD